MILYFSGTGNSEYAAKRIGRELDDEVVCLFEKIRSRDFTKMHSDRPWIIVTPTYAWRIPRIIQEWLMKTALAGNRDIYFVMTCGGSIGNSGKYLRKLSDSKHMKESLEIIQRAEQTINEAILTIKNGKAFSRPAVTFQDRMNSGIVNNLFYPVFVHAKKFYAADTCISCGKCAKICPLNNIRMENRKPVWGKNCTHCMACICHCPTEAIEYGKHSKGKPRYVCPKTDH